MVKRGGVILILMGDCLEHVKALESNSVDSLITDPPAGISFMNKSWDDDKGGRDQWVAWMTEVMRECLRVLKPGGHGFVWALPRTSHWTATALENAGFEVRDIVTHCFGSGFPKASAFNRTKSGVICQCASNKHNSGNTSASRQNEGRNDNLVAGFDDALPPSNALRSTNESPDSRADCPQSGDSYDEQLHPLEGDVPTLFPSPQCVQERNRSAEHDGVLASEASHSPSQAQHSVHPSNQDCSSPNCVSPSEQNDTSVNKKQKRKTHLDIDSPASDTGHKGELSSAWDLCITCGKPRLDGWYNGGLKPASEHWILVRKPCSEKTVAANVIKYGCGGINIDASRIEAADQAVLDAAVKRMTGNVTQHAEDRQFLAGTKTIQPNSAQGRFPANLILDEEAGRILDEQGGLEASRFFYCAKTSKSERNAGLEGMPESRTKAYAGGKIASAKTPEAMGGERTAQNFHPTVKPQKLMQYLIRMITQPGGVVLDPFMGSGSTGVAAKSLGFRFIGIERDADYVAIAERRIG